ncbi:YdcF family protein, partial [Ralstonia insidiosa]|nr:YdcF family protein [Ralstonia insidiosa]
SFDGIGSRTPYHFLAQSMIIDFLGLMYQYKTILTIYFAMLFWLAILQTI